jgi:hypothetical protein
MFFESAVNISGVSGIEGIVVAMKNVNVKNVHGICFPRYNVLKLLLLYQSWMKMRHLAGNPSKALF